MSGHLVLAIAASCTLAVLAPGAAGQDSACDRSLIENMVEGPWAYSRRGDRCEGLYVEQVSGAALAIVSFTSAFDDFDLGQGEPLIVEWTPLGTAGIRLRARSLQPKLYYRMDSRPPAGAARFRWPSDVLAGVGMERSILGVVGTAEWPLAGIRRRILLPLRIGQGGTAAAGEVSYELLVRPGVELREVYVSLAALGDDGREEDFLVDEQALNFGFYPAERAFAVPLPTLPRAGLYYLSLAAELAGGGDATVEAYFHHPGG